MQPKITSLSQKALKSVQHITLSKTNFILLNIEMIKKSTQS